MENMMVRQRYARRPSASLRRRRAPRTGGSLRTVIVRQVAICLLLLLVAGIFKIIDIPATNFITDKIRYALSRNVELKSIFTTVENFAADIRKSIAPDTGEKPAANDLQTPDGDADTGAAAEGSGAAGSGQGAAEGSGNVPQTDGAAGSVSPMIASETGGGGQGAGTAEGPGDAAGGAENNTATLSSSEASSSIDNESEGYYPEDQNAGTPEKSVLSASSGSGESYAAEMLVPVEGTLGTPFGEITDKITGTSKMHNGIDINAKKQSSVIAVLDGKVSETGASPAYGSYIRITHENGLQTLYANCSSMIAQEGANVKKGDAVAVIGDAGASAGIHLHFEIWENGAAVDPLEFISVPVR